MNVQAAFSAEEPGELYLAIETEGAFAATYALGVLCEPTDDTLTGSWVLDGRGCALEADLFAWVGPAQAASTCAGPAETSVQRIVPDFAVEGVLFAGNTTCVSDSDDLLLTVVVPE